MDRFERLRDATHQRLLPEADIRGYLDANDLVLLSSEVTREKVDLEERPRACGVRRGGAHADPWACAGGAVRDRGRLVRLPQAGCASSPSRCCPARPGDEPREEPRDERLPDRSRCGTGTTEP